MRIAMILPGGTAIFLSAATTSHEQKRLFVIGAGSMDHRCAGYHAAH
jgi:hypothetical protein